MKAQYLQQAIKYASQVLDIVVDTEARQGIKYLSPDLVIKVTRRHRIDKRDRTAEFVVTIGKPNYEGRIFVRACKKAGERFPVSKVQLKFFSDKKKGRK